MNEQPVEIGPAPGLVGILSLPDALDPALPVVLVPNSGGEHRVGPSRLHVELARALAAAGLAAVRFDRAGHGDSPDTPAPPLAEPGADLVAAMDLLEARGFASRFVGIGLLGAAHPLHCAARRDERLVGAVFLDGYTYRTPRFWVNHGVDRLTQAKRNAVRIERMMQSPATEDGDPGVDEGAVTPPAAQMKADLQGFIARNMALCYLYTGDLQAEYNYRDQLVDAFPFLRSYPRLTLHHLIEVDQTFSRRVVREELIGLLVDWVLRGPQASRARRPESRR